MNEQPPSDPAGPPAPAGDPDPETTAGPDAEAPAGHDETLAADPDAPPAGGSTFARVRPYLLRAGIGLGALLALFLAAASWIWFSTDLDDVEPLGESAVILDRNGVELAVLSQDGNRMSIDLDELPDHVPDALVAAEDQRFYDHAGVDVFGIGRAVWNNLTDDDLEGGSTITQQLVKNRYLNADRTITRKVREAVLAVKIERDADKDDILEQYLNTVYFGRGAYGVEAAARAYFDIGAAELDVGQAAFLMGILRAPGSYDVDDSAATGAESDARARRDQVLQAMADMGTLAPAAMQNAVNTPLRVVPAPPPTILSEGVAPHFVELVRRMVIDELGEAALYRDGLRIHTTLDLDDQRAAEEAVARTLDDPDDPQAAVVGIDRSGAVRAWVGGRDFEALQVDLVAASGGSGRQPGSTFKPFVLAAALADGIGAGTNFAAPPEITLQPEGAEPWTVRNAGGAGYGRLSLGEATINSVNTVYAQAVLRVGPERVAALAQDLGISRQLAAEPSIALGTEEVAPIDLATAYSTLSRSGERIEPYVVTSVEDADGETVWAPSVGSADQVLDPAVADTVTHILSDVPRRGTARRAALDRPMAAKTGTTQQNADAWLAGYTPEYTAVVWVGRADSTEPMDLVDGERVFGGSIPAEIWRRFMEGALVDVDVVPFPDPDPDLLRDTEPTPALTLASDPVVAGGDAVFSVTGVQTCLSSWHVVVRGPTELPPSATAAPGGGDGDRPGRGNGRGGDDDDGADAEDGSDAAAAQPEVTVVELAGPMEAATDEEATTAVAIPADAFSGPYAAELVCDAGAGGAVIATVAFAVDGQPVVTTTTSTSTSSTTTSSSTTSTSTTSTSTTSTSTTSTTSTTTTTTEPAEGD